MSNIARQIPRSSLIWLLAAQLVVIVPHMPRLSWWMIAIWALCGFWRLAMYRGQAQYPGALMRICLIAFGCFGIALDFGNLGGLDIAVALLILAFSLKLLELRERRDLFLVIFLAYFIIAAAFLFSQSLALAVYQIGSLLFVTAALTAMQNGQEAEPRGRPFKTAAMLLVQATPLMVVFFVVFPRLSPLWAVPSSEASAGTGMSDSMTPGDLAELTLSPKTAFRAVFEDDIPTRVDLYWRAMVLSYFDGRSWTADDPSLQFEDPSQASSWQQQPQSKDLDLFLIGKPVSYRVTYEASQQPWLYTLPVAALKDQQHQTSTQKVIASNDLSLRYSKDINARTTFEFESYTRYEAEPELSELRRQQETRLPSGLNPRTRTLARQWYAESQSDLAFVQRVLRWFTEEQFYYTLKPPILGRHSIDEFLFTTQAGFCEYYASAFTFMLRSVGIPSRIVIGYQGGERNPYDNSLTIRQYDAHAWTEVWFAGQGWVRYDPTAAVAPQRVLSNLQDALHNPDEFLGGDLLSPLQYSHIEWLTSFRLRLDAINHNWQKWVINFDSTRQLEVLTGVLGEITPLRMASAVAASLVLVIGLIAVSLLRQRVSPAADPATRVYMKLCSSLEKHGLQRQRGETPGDFSRRIAAQHPELGGEVEQLTREYEAIVYADDRRLETLKRFASNVRAFKPGKPFARVAVQ